MCDFFATSSRTQISFKCFQLGAYITLWALSNPTVKSFSTSWKGETAHEANPFRAADTWLGCNSHCDPLLRWRFMAIPSTDATSLSPYS